MNTLALDLDDRALSVARSGTVLSTLPSAVFVGGDARSGSPAWRFVRSQPMTTSTQHLGAVLSGRGAAARDVALAGDEVARLLAGHFTAATDAIWVAAPACADVRGLSAILAAAQDRALRIGGFVDAATACVGALGLQQPAIVLELGLHHAAATAVDVESGYARRRRAALTESSGLMELYEAWLELISATMVKRTRFDPLHDATIEQALFDVLPELAHEAVVQGGTIARVSKGAERFQVELTQDQFVAAAQPVARRVVALVHGLRPAGASRAIVVPRAVAELPGLRDELDQFTGCELVRLSDGFAAAAVSQLALPVRAPDRDSAPLIRRLPLDSQAELAPMTSREILGERRSREPGPSHVLFEGRAYSLDVLPLIVGRAAPGSGPSAGTDPTASIALPEGLAGVSRRHCTLAGDRDRIMLLDHSTFGTFVNGERVAERVPLRTGDRVRLGDPGIELELIALGDATH